MYDMLMMKPFIVCTYSNEICIFIHSIKLGFGENIKFEQIFFGWLLKEKNMVYVPMCDIIYISLSLKQCRIWDKQQPLVINHIVTMWQRGLLKSKQPVVYDKTRAFECVQSVYISMELMWDGIN